ncbi:IS66 family transposase [Lignipirellula cremea]|uniref:Transposase IS66 family protein n=1 Tax=Lignipirellula cremea TaxID=2528010 RepID=A0A518DZ80_9BACT|nr:IS66 family transposase [Lignipirellula cremea]QDU95802.1 Transposase IS66 family protein [Lignipirellula cremea]QDU97111.1 Transposase IS66 family protein [Lignipirellula cremea]
MDASLSNDDGLVDAAFLEKVLRGRLSEAEARTFAAAGAEIIAFTMLALTQRVAGQQAAGPNTPSAAVPPYAKPTASPRKGQRRRGGQKGHPGVTRPPLPEPDRRRELQLDCCPECQGKLQRTGDTRTRRSEDIPDGLKPVITEDILHRDYCPTCKKRVEPKPPDVLPNCTLGNRTLVLSAVLHYLQGLTISQIVDTFNFHLRMKVTPGGLMQMWHRLATLLFAWYVQIQAECLDSARLNADETGWRVQGKTHWLWCFAGPDATFYMIDRSRGSPALQKFFTKAFEGVLITDFWSPYDAIVCADKQKCWPHLLRDMASVDEKHAGDKVWQSFARRVISVYREAKKLHAAKATTAAVDYDIAAMRLESRLATIAGEAWNHPDAARLAKRLAKYGDQLLTFLWHDEIPSDNNHGERQIRPAVMIRKNSYGNHSDRGMLTQSVLMTIFRTLKLRNQQPLETILEALANYAKTGKIPPLPQKAE